jgi:hypothetical protein
MVSTPTHFAPGGNAPEVNEPLHVKRRVHVAKFLGFALYWLSLDLAYRYFVAPYFAYSGFVLDPSPAKYAEGLVVGLLVLWALPTRFERISDVIVVLAAVAVILPVALLYGLQDRPREHLLGVVAGYALMDLLRRGRRIRLPVVRGGSVAAMAVAAIGAGGVAAWFIVSGGLAYFNLDPMAVYDTRREVGVVVDQGAMGYVNNWAYKVWGPFLLAVGAWRRQYWLVALGLGLHVFWFGVSSHKSVIVYPIIVLALWVLLSKKMSAYVIPAALAVVVLGSVAVAVWFDGIAWASVVVRRALFVSANNAYIYYEFFTYNPHVWWSNSVLRGVVIYPYDVGPARLIGAYGGTEAHVNNTFLSTGYMHAGWVGVALYGALAGLLLKLADSTAGWRLPVPVAASFVVIPLITTVVGADLTTGMLTHGVAMAILMALLARGGGWYAHQARGAKG